MCFVNHPSFLIEFSSHGYCSSIILKHVICQVVFISLMVKQREAACLGIVILLALVTTAILTITHFKVYHKDQVVFSSSFNFQVSFCINFDQPLLQGKSFLMNTYFLQENYCCFQSGIIGYFNFILSAKICRS